MNDGRTDGRIAERRKGKTYHETFVPRLDLLLRETRIIHEELHVFFRQLNLATVNTHRSSYARFNQQRNAMRAGRNVSRLMVDAQRGYSS